MNKRLSFLLPLAVVSFALSLFAWPVSAQVAGTPVQPGPPARLPRDILIKTWGEGVPVYYLAEDGKRYVFPNQKTYDTWFTDFSDIHLVTSRELSAIPLGGNIRYRPGIRMIKIVSDPKTYVVDKHGVLRWVTTEEIARGMYGARWNQHIDDVSDAYFANYQMGEPLESLTDYYPSVSARSCQTINADFGMKVSLSPRKATTAYNVIDSLLLIPPDFMRGTVLISGPGEPASEEASDVTERELVVGARGVTLGDFTFSGENEEMELRRVRLRLTNPGAVGRLLLYDGEMLVGSQALAPGASGDAYSLAVSDFVIPKNGKRVLTVKADLNRSGFGTGEGSPLGVVMSVSGLQIAGTAPWSTTMISTVNQFDQPGPTFVLRTARATVENVELPESALKTGANVLARFKVTAEGHDDTLLRGLRLKSQCAFKTEQETEEFVDGEKKVVVSVVDNEDVTLELPQPTPVRLTDGDGSYVAGSAYDDPCEGGMTVDFTPDVIIKAGTSQAFEVAVSVKADSLRAGDVISSVLESVDFAIAQNESGAPIAGTISVVGVPSKSQVLTVPAPQAP